MSCEFAKRELIEQLLAGKLSAQKAQAFCQHLLTDCASCDALFESLGETKLREQLLAAIDRSTGFVLPSKAETKQALAEFSKKIPSKRFTWLSPSAFVVAATTMVVLALLIIIPKEIKEPRFRFKGDGGFSLELERGKLVQGELEITGAVSNFDKVSSNEFLLFSYTLFEQGKVEILHIDSNGTKKQVYCSSKAESIGRHELKKGGQAMMFSLLGLKGIQKFEGIFTPEKGGIPRSQVVVTMQVVK